MEFIGYTALIDAIIALVAFGILYNRKSKMSESNSKASALSSYLMATTLFLFLISATVLKTAGLTQQWMFIVSDLVLWVSLVMFIKMMYVGSENASSKNMVLWVFYILAAMRTLWQLAGVLAIDLSYLGTSMIAMLSKLDAWLMYIVWVPSAIYFIWIALSTDSNVVRSRSLMFAIGLLLITFTWAFRFLIPSPVEESVGYMLVSVASVVGFMLLLGGVFYRGSSNQMTANS